MSNVSFIFGLLLGAVLGIIAAVALGHASRKYACSGRHVKLKDLRGFNNPLESLDCMSGGIRIRGSNSESIKLRRIDDPNDPGPLSFIQLCQTSRGRFFEHRFEISNGVVTHMGASLLTVDQAKAWLADDAKTYGRVFGLIELA